MANGSAPTEYGIRLREFTNAVSKTQPPAAPFAFALEFETPPFVILRPLLSAIGVLGGRDEENVRGVPGEGLRLSLLPGERKWWW